MRSAHRSTLPAMAALVAAMPAIAAVPQLGIRNAAPHRIVHASRVQTLYDQMGVDRGTGVNSQNYEAAYDAYDDQAADDFVVPEGVHWKITEVDMAGYYMEGPADSMAVTFYNDKHGKPRKMVGQFTVIPPFYDGNGGFPLDLGHGITLKPGHYWLSIQANQVFDEAGQWAWASSDDTTNSPAMWRNPGDGFAVGCTDWTVETVCIGWDQGDHLFALRGKVR